jgi:predicted nucleotidyltransferase
MTVTGYEEALSAATDVQIEEALVVRVASLPSLAMLKLFAWNDRGHATTKDARDLLMFLRHYGKSEESRLYGDDFTLLSSVDHDLYRAGARLLGQDVRRLALVSTSDQLLAILADRTRADRLVTHMMGALPGNEREDLVETLLSEFTQGLQGT